MEKEASLWANLHAKDIALAEAVGNEAALSAALSAAHAKREQSLAAMVRAGTACSRQSYIVHELRNRLRCSNAPLQQRQRCVASHAALHVSSYSLHAIQREMVNTTCTCCGSTSHEHYALSATPHPAATYTHIGTLRHFSHPPQVVKMRTAHHTAHTANTAAYLPHTACRDYREVVMR